MAHTLQYLAARSDTVRTMASFLRKLGKRPLGCFAALGIALGILVAPSSSPGASEVSGRDVVRRMEAVRARGDGAVKRYELHLIDDAGRTVTRRLTTYRKRCGASVRQMLVIDDPPDVAGTAVLTWSHADGPPSMWLFLPELDRVRQLNPFAQGDTFLGSDITYGDVAPLPVDFRDHRLLGVSEVDGHEVYEIESTPRMPEPYSRIVTWVQRDAYLPVRVAYYDTDGALLRTGRISDVRLVQGIPTPFRIEIEDVQREHRTELRLADVEYDRPLACRELTKRRLQRTP
jgi:hypothetical protein